MININKKTAMNKFKFSDIATISTQKKKPTDEDKFHYIGLEHLDSKSLKVTRYGADVAPKGEKLVMKKGDVLFGKRRAYQKKVAIAPFDGIFSAHGMILRPNEKVISRELFPFFISSDAFLDKAIKISVGSLSPTINNSDIKKLEFELPDIREQEKYSNALFAINDTKEAYINLIGNLDKIQKSRFVEMFGDPFENPKWEVCPLKTHVRLINGRAYKQDELLSNGKYRVLRVGNFFSQKDWYYSDMELDADKYCEKGDLLYAWSASFGARTWQEEKTIYHYHIWKLNVDENFYNKQFLQTLLNLSTERLKNATHGITMPHLTKEGMENNNFILPPIELQNDYIRFENQIDKSKFNLKCAITELDNLSDKIKSEIFS